MQRLRDAQIAMLAVGGLLGLWHLWFAAQALFVFRVNEPWTSWVAILAGPGMTLIAVVLAVAYMRLAGVLLCIASAVALIAFGIGAGPDYDAMFPYLTHVTVPMAALGLLLLAVSRSTRVEAAA